MTASKTNQSLQRDATKRDRRISPQLRSLMAMSPHIASREMDLFPEGPRGPTGYDKTKIYVLPSNNPALVRKAIELREGGATYVMLHGKSVSARYSVTPAANVDPQFRTRRIELRLNYELKA